MNGNKKKKWPNGKRETKTKSKAGAVAVAVAGAMEIGATLR